MLLCNRCNNPSCLSLNALHVDVPPFNVMTLEALGEQGTDPRLDGKTSR